MNQDKSPEWHLANILGYIAIKPLESLEGLLDDDAARMRLLIRVGDIRAAYRSLIASGGTFDAEGKWVESGDYACPHCGGSGHKDDVIATDEKKVGEQCSDR